MMKMSQNIQKMIQRLYIFLQKLDQERNIWISYDGANREDNGYCAGIFNLIPDDIVKPPLAEYCLKWYEEDVKEGDYLIKVG